MVRRSRCHRAVKDPNYESRIQAAIDGVISSKYKNLRRAALGEDVKYQTLRDRAKGKHKSQKDADAGRQLLTPAQESVLLDWADHLSMSGKPFDRTALRSRAMDLSGKQPGKNWHRRYLKRHPKLIAAKPAKLDPKRAKNFNRSVVREFQMMLQELDERVGGIPAEHLWNEDEKGVQMGGGRKNSGKNYYFLRDQCNRYRISSDNLELVTIVECVSAAGVSVPPMFILSDGPMPDLREIDNISSVATSHTGWIDNELAEEWLQKVFIPFALSQRVDKDKPIVLLLDGHESHESHGMKRIVYSVEEADVIIFCFPSKCTHKLQPLDVAVFSSVARAWRENCDRRCLENVRINRYNVIQEYMSIRPVITSELIKGAFKKTGLHPFNPDVFTDEDFAPSMASSSLAHVPSSFPDEIPTSDTAIPTDAEDDAEMRSDEEGSQTTMDTGTEGDETGTGGDVETGAQGDETGTSQDLVDNILISRPESMTDTGLHTLTSGIRLTRSFAPHLNINDVLDNCIVPLAQDEKKSREELLASLCGVRQQLRGMAQIVHTQHAELSAANAHCTVMKRELADTCTQLNNEKKKRERGSTKVKARFVTLPELKATFDAEDVVRVEREHINNEKEVKKAAEAAARHLRISKDAETKIFDAPLSSFKRKDDLIAIARALQLSGEGTISELKTRIDDHLKANPHLAEVPRFAMLYQAPGTRRPKTTEIQQFHGYSSSFTPLPTHPPLAGPSSEVMHTSIPHYYIPQPFNAFHQSFHPQSFHPPPQ